MQDQQGRAWLKMTREENGADVHIHDAALLPNVSDIATLIYRAATTNAEPLVKAVTLRLEQAGLRGIGLVTEGGKFSIVALPIAQLNDAKQKALAAARDGLELQDYRLPQMESAHPLVEEIEYLRRVIIEALGDPHG